MMEYLLKRELPRHGITDAVVSGAGTGTMDDQPASAHAITVMQEIGIDISDHRSRQITQAIVDNTDIFVVMTPEHGVTLAFHYGVDPEKMAIPGEGIPDPYGRDLKTYRLCRDALVEAVPQLIEDIKALWP
jgi:protein-tyrosine phosphatase